MGTLDRCRLSVFIHSCLRPSLCSIIPFNIKLSAPRTPGRGHLPPATYHLQRLLQPRFQLPPATYHLPRGSPPARALSLSWGIRESLPPPDLPSSRSRLPLPASAQLYLISASLKAFNPFQQSCYVLIPAFLRKVFRMTMPWQFMFLALGQL